MTHLKLMVAGGAAVLALAACGSSSKSSSVQTGSSGTSAPTTSAAPTTTAPTSMYTISVGSSSLGQLLVTDTGRTVYTFDSDTPNHSSCTGPCATFWPAVTATGGTHAGPGVNGTLGVISGTNQVTLDGHPLYMFSKDTGPGDTLGNGTENNSWHVVLASSTLNQPAAASPATTAAPSTHTTSAPAVSPGPTSPAPTKPPVTSPPATAAPTTPPTSPPTAPPTAPSTTSAPSGGYGY